MHVQSMACSSFLEMPMTKSSDGLLTRLDGAWTLQQTTDLKTFCPIKCEKYQNYFDGI